MSGNTSSDEDENEIYGPAEISYSNIIGGYDEVYNGGHEGDGNIDADPKFLGTGDHPMALAMNSPCIDAGDPATTAEDVGEIDLAGNERMVRNVDMGAYENQALDSDGDGLFDAIEDANGNGIVDTGETDPESIDTDGDGIFDGTEDADHDGEVDEGETDPCNPDTDYDGLSDGVEVTHGSDPNDSASVTEESMARTIYVSENPAGEKNGRSWTDAFSNLSYALKCTIAGDHVWVAKGTYTPTDEAGGEGGRYKSYQMKNNVSIFGGFAGDEDPETFNMDERDLSANETVLSGDFDRNDDSSDEQTLSENAYHVFYHPEGINLDETAVIDGFSIKSGNANNNDNLSAFRRGGGMYNSSSSPKILNCSFLNNSAISYGGAIYSQISSVMITGCEFSNNSAIAGGAISDYASSTIVSNCFFEQNAASQIGGAIHNRSSSVLSIDSSIFSQNSANLEGGSLDINSSSASISKCSFIGNSASAYYGGSIANNVSSSVIISSCTFSNNSAGYGGGALYNYAGSELEIKNSIFNVNSAVSYGGSILNKNESVLSIINSTFSDNSAGIDGSEISNMSSNASLVNCIMWGNAESGMIHSSSSSESIKYCNISGNFIGEGNIDVDPKFSGADDHLFSLSNNSPCINAGDPATTTDEAGETDLAGNERLVCAVDMGAYENQEPDSDCDGLFDAVEDANGNGIVDTGETDPTDSDTDDDGLDDGIEDTNKNGVVDAGETDPLNVDSDGDGITDGTEDADHDGEVDAGETDPRNADTDGDQMPDGYEKQYNLNPLVSDGADDADGDGFSNFQEYSLGTNPQDPASKPQSVSPNAKGLSAVFQLLLND